MEQVCQSALCCLAAVLLALFIRSAAKSEENSAPIRTLLRCWLLRAQELMLTCETTHSLMEEAAPMVLRELHSCAALFCQTCAQSNRWGGLFTVDTGTQSDCVSDTFWKILGLAITVHEAAIHSGDALLDCA